MPETTLQAAAPAPLTTLTEDEILFRDNIRQFADEKIRPLPTQAKTGLEWATHLSILGRKRFFGSSLPQRSSALLTSVCTSTITPEEASSRESSSTANVQTSQTSARTN